MDLAKKGGELYKTHCQECHGPAIDSKALPASEAFALFKDKKRWIKNDAGAAAARRRDDPDQPYRHRQRAGRGPCETARSRRRPI